MTISILTIGYGNLDISQFISNLQRNNVQVVIDIRSKPYSRYRPDYNRNNLEQHLVANKIGYKFQGDKLGGLPSNPTLLTDNLPDYNKIRNTLPYQRGLDYLEKGLEFGCRMVLLCACSDYMKCHRHNLVGYDLERLGYEVAHILRDGSKVQDKRLF